MMRSKMRALAIRALTRCGQRPAAVERTMMRIRRAARPENRAPHSGAEFEDGRLRIEDSEHESAPFHRPSSILAFIAAAEPRATLRDSGRDSRRVGSSPAAPGHVGLLPRNTAQRLVQHLF